MALSDGWFVVMTKPKMELEARDHLLRQGFEVYLPIWRELKQRRGKWVGVESPMFPRYLFLRPAFPDQSLAPVRSTRAVSQLVRFGSQAAMADDRLIRSISLLEESRRNSYDIQTPFEKGSRVEVVDGPFRGVSAEVLECDQQRVILLLQVIGKVQKLTFDAALCRAT